MKKTKLFKSLLMAAGLLVGASAWADTETINVLSEDYESYATGDITATMQSNGWHFQSRNNKNEIKIVQGASGSANETKYFDFYYPDGGASRNQYWDFGVASSLNADNWTLTFSAALNPGANNSANKFWITGTSSGNVSVANADVTNPFVGLIGTAAAAVTYTPSIGATSYSDEIITLTSGAWYNFTVSATDIDAEKNTLTLYVKIASGSTTVWEKTVENLSTASIGTLRGICWNSPRGYSRLNLDNVLLTKEVDAAICADPSYVITGADGINRKFTLACETAGSTVYYATSELEKGNEGWTTYTTEVTTDATTIYAYAQKGTTTSNIINFATGAGTEISLNAPVITVSNMVANGDALNAVFDANYNASGVEFTPAATLSATFTPKGGEAGAATLPFTATENGVLTVTASAEGFASAQTVINVYANYVQDWQSVDFSSLIGLDAVKEALGDDWSLQSGHGRWASWDTSKDGSYNFYQHGEGGASNTTINDNIYMREVVVLAEGMGLGRNVTGGEAVSVSNTSAGDIVAFEIYNGYGKDINKGTNTFMSYALSNGTDRPHMNSTNGALLVQATVYAPVKFNSMSIVGDFSENAWDATAGITMTRDANNVHLWTATVENFVADGKKYEYKAVADQNYDDYVLPAGDNAEFTFGTEAYPAGATYDLTFTVNTKSNTVSLKADEQATYTVAGTESFFGSNWSATDTNNDMTKNEDGIYTISYNDVELTNGTYVEYKVVKNHDWEVASYPSSNNSFSITKDGTYDITISINPLTKEVSQTVNMQHTYTVAGDAVLFTSNWDVTDTDNNMTQNADGTYSITYTNVALTGNVSYKVVEDHAWKSNGGNEWPNDNRVIGINMAGNYDVTIHFNPATGEVFETMAVYKSISDAGYATFCAPYDINFAETGVKAYIAKLTDTTVSFEEVSSAPNGTGVLLKADEGTYKLKMEVSGQNVENNILVGTLESKEIPANSFVLLNGNSGVGFYKTLDVFTVDANTAYIEALPESARTFIGFDFDNTTTAIDGVETVKEQSNVVYDLQGRRVVKAQKGLYIVNGKKVLVK